MSLAFTILNPKPASDSMQHAPDREWRHLPCQQELLVNAAFIRNCCLQLFMGNLLLVQACLPGNPAPGIEAFWDWAFFLIGGFGFWTLQTIVQKYVLLLESLQSTIECNCNMQKDQNNCQSHMYYHHGHRSMTPLPYGGWILARWIMVTTGVQLDPLTRPQFGFTYSLSPSPTPPTLTTSTKTTLTPVIITKQQDSFEMPQSTLMEQCSSKYSLFISD